MGMRSTAAKNHGRMVTQPAADFLVGGSNPCRSTVTGGTAAMFARLGFEPATEKYPVICITIQPQLILG